jgi:hypothetical protein
MARRCPAKSWSTPPHQPATVPSTSWTTASAPGGIGPPGQQGRLDLGAELRSHRPRVRRRRADLLPERPRLCRQHPDDRGGHRRAASVARLQS